MERLEIDVITKSYQNQTRHFIDIRKALVCGYFMQIAHREGEKGAYLTFKDNQVRLTPCEDDDIALTRIRFLLRSGGQLAPLVRSRHATRVGPL